MRKQNFVAFLLSALALCAVFQTMGLGLWWVGYYLDDKAILGMAKLSKDGGFFGGMTMVFFGGIVAAATKKA
jgi:hypothetical protein